VAGGQNVTPALPQSGRILVVIKQFEAWIDGMQEIRNLKMLRAVGAENGNIVHHLSTIEYSFSPEYMIIFPQASLGDLSQFLNCGSSVAGRPGSSCPGHHICGFKDRFPFAEAGMNIMHALSKQTRDIASALQSLHDPRLSGAAGASGRWPCAHMDLKPSHVLIYDEG